MENRTDLVNASFAGIALLFWLLPGASQAAGTPEIAPPPVPLGEYAASSVSTEQLRAYHDAVSSKPHRAGTAGDRAVVDYLAKTMRGWGLDVEVHAIDVYLAEPGPVELEIVSPVQQTLSIQEESLEADPFSQDSTLEPGWNAYSGSGEAQGRVVYANYGRKQDFEELVELGIDVKGAVVIARYGGNFRGYKAKFAEAHGAAGLIIYTDPIDSGWFKGLPYPDGGWANGTQIQRGSIMTLDWTGDPLTPFEPATPEAKRLDPAELPLPKIPVQPIGFTAAQEILSRMTGDVVPSGWQGGLPFTYRVQGGEELRVRLQVKQERKLVRTHNVIGTLRGATEPERRVVIGSHHDAWIHGAGDPGAGTILVLEAARIFADAAKAGRRPARTIQFAHWGAEEYGILGSVEWVEANRVALSAGAIAYLNLDGAAMGPDLRASSTPTLKRVIAEEMRKVMRPDGRNAFEAWEARSGKQMDEDLEAFGTLGGGSDHVGFNCHLAIPAAGMSGGGSPGTAYHSAYDNLHWYRKVVGDDYDPARQLTEWVVRVAARLAHDPIMPIDPSGYAPELRSELEKFRERLESPDRKASPEAIQQLDRLLAEVERLDGIARALSHESAGREPINRVLLQMERNWLSEEGIPGRPWYRSLLVSTDADSGYASWFLPGLRHALEYGDDADWIAQSKRYLKVLAKLIRDIESITPAAEAPIPSAAQSRSPSMDSSAASRSTRTLP